MNKEIKKLFTNILSLVVVQGGNYIIPLLTFPYLVRIYGTENYGLIAYSLSFSQFFVIFSGFGLNLYGPRELAIANNDDKEISKIFSGVYIVKLVLLAMSFVVLLTLVYTVPQFIEYRLILLMAFTVVVAQTISPVWFFQGVEKMKWITIINLSSKLMYAAILFLVFTKKTSVVWVPFVNGVTQLLSALFGVWIVLRKMKVKVKIPSIHYLKKVVKDSSSFFLSRVSVSMYTVSNTFFLGSFGTMEMAGIYAMAEKLFMALQSVYHPLVNALYPFISRNKNIKLFKKVFYVSIIVNVAIVGGLFLFTDFVFDLLFNNYELESVLAFKLLLVIALGIPLSILLGYPLLGAMGHIKFTNYSVVFSSVFHIFGLLLLAFLDKISVNNIIYTLMFTEFFVLVIRIYGVGKYRLWKSY